MTMKAREGDLIETREGLIFDVKGLTHPPDRVISYVRYFPHSTGDRERGGIKYEKVYSLKEIVFDIYMNSSNLHMIWVI